MKRHHVLIVIGLLVFLAGWFAWSALLTESEIPRDTPAPQTR
jgi:hypothetical protein